MFEFDQYRATTTTTAALVKPTEPIEFASGVSRRSLLFWSEHCVECAAPECYQSCDLFQARPDDRCRRFEFGMRRNRQLKGSAGSAAEIVFGRWAKLETRGNTHMLPAIVVRAIETTLFFLAPLVTKFGQLVRRFGGSAPWSSLTFELQDMLAKKLQQRSSNTINPSGFLIEIYNPENQVCRVKFAVASSSSRAAKSGNVAPLPFWALLELEPGYNRKLIDYDSIKAVVQSGIPYNISLTPETESGTHLVFITLDFVSFISSASAEPSIKASQIGRTQSRPNVKCVVFDLDNTLWDGVLVEGDVVLKPDVEALFQALDERGILISVASKNSASEALAQLQQLGLEKYLVYPVINWSQKSENIKLLTGKINIGLDTILFIDDNPFERNEVSSALPMVEVLPETALETLLSHPRLVGGKTEESKSRRVMYQQQVVRDDAVLEFGDNYIEFLRQCKIELEITSEVEDHKDRVIELLQRTNQLNFSGRKYTREEIHVLLEDDDIEKHVMRCKDKFGDYGIVGFSLTHTRNNEVTVQDFMLSCRVQGKLIEKAFFDFLVKSTIEDQGTLYVNLVPNQRNTPAQAVLNELGFDRSDDGCWWLDIEPELLAVDFLTIRSE